MASTSNMLSNESSLVMNTEIKNKGFAILDDLFKEHGWHLIQNEMNKICYTKVGQETDVFDIQIDQTTIRVSIPLKNSTYQYTTSFKEYFQASEYVEARLLDFISN